MGLTELMRRLFALRDAVREEAEFHQAQAATARIAVELNRVYDRLEEAQKHLLKAEKEQADLMGGFE